MLSVLSNVSGATTVLLFRLTPPFPPPLPSLRRHLVNLWLAFVQPWRYEVDFFWADIPDDRMCGMRMAWAVAIVTRLAWGFALPRAPCFLAIDGKRQGRISCHTHVRIRAHVYAVAPLYTSVSDKLDSEFVQSYADLFFPFYSWYA